MRINFSDRTDAFYYKRGERKPSGDYRLTRIFKDRNLAAVNDQGILEFWDAKRFVIHKTPPILGNPFPGQTLTSTESGQWYVNDVSTGSPSTTYTVDVRDIGKSVRCGDSSPVTIWHPTDVTTNMILLTPNVGALHSIEPDVEATDGQTVRRILDQSGNGWHADQATGANQPTRQVSEVGGNDTLLFDGTNDFMSFSGGALGLFLTRQYGYIISSIKNVSNTGTNRGVFLASSSSSANSTMFTLLSRQSSSDKFAAGGRILGSASFVSASSDSNDNWSVVTGSSLWANGVIRLRINGALANQSSYPLSGTSEGPSQGVTVGKAANDYAYCDLACLMALSPDTELSAVNLARLERYAYLCGPGPTEVTLDPSDPWA